MINSEARARRRRITAETKLRALQEARQGGVPISQVCARYGIRPSQFYQWEKLAERAAIEALRGQKRGRKKLTAREEALLAEITRLREVIAELNVENLSLKKGAW